MLDPAGFKTMFARALIVLVFALLRLALLFVFAAGRPRDQLAIWRATPAATGHFRPASAGANRLCFSGVFGSSGGPPNPLAVM